MVAEKARWVQSPLLARSAARGLAISWPAATLAVVAVLVIAGRWTTRSQYLFDLDSIAYARALEQFDLRLTQPPLPGYYLYIQLGRVARAALADANLSLVFLSALFGALLVPATYALGRELFDRRTALAAALLTLTGPIFWYQSSFASPRIAEGFFATLIVWMGVRLRRRDEPWAFWLLPVALAVAGGVRQQMLIYLLPFSVWATARAPWRRRFAAALLLAIGVAAWLLPTLDAAGGLAGYRLLSQAQWEFFVVNQTGVIYGHGPGEMLRRLGTNLALIGAYAFFTCLAGPLLLLVGLRRTYKSRQPLPALPTQALLLATLPALAFLAFVHIEQIGHALPLAPFFALVVARVVASSGRGTFAPLVGLVLATNLLFVLLAPARLVANRVGTPTIASIRERDHFVAAGIAALRAGSPDETLVLTSPLSYGFIEEYAPDYRYYLLPGLFEPANGAAVSQSQAILSNGLVPAQGLHRAGPGQIAAPSGARRFVTFGYESNIAAMLGSTEHVELPDPAMPSLAVVERPTPVEIWFYPGHLELTPLLPNFRAG